MRILAVSCAVLAVLAGCTTSRLLSQKPNPDYVGKSFKSVMVVAVTADEMVRRPFEDRMVAQLGRRGIKGIPGYDLMGARRGRIEEVDLRQAVARSGAEGVLITRVTRVDRSQTQIAGGTMAIGWVGFYGFYAASWETVNVAPQTITGDAATVSETRLFDARDGTLAWTGVMESKETDDLSGALTQYIRVIFDAMVSDRVL